MIKPTFLRQAAIAAVASLALVPAALAHESSSAGKLKSGMASWYGAAFHGRQTANGETFDMNDLTAAHRSLPFGTRVRVTNEATDKSVVVRINDRGPYAGSRVIDLSKEAAKDIGLVSTGVGRVKLEVLGSA
ncbi:septal ring lytic transglycosylase RlpA family protein [Paracoccus sp. T5]|uniref:septal ring lytic transglycosylase RlpA family protein n=1 Tax=Paracoccus sp. T5 TaxID=3402161 RepID=UPI003ADFA799